MSAKIDWTAIDAQLPAQVGPEGRQARQVNRVKKIGFFSEFRIYVNVLHFLQTLWKRIDVNGNGIVSLSEMQVVIKFIKASNI
jgi:hypothetical protein